MAEIQRQRYRCYNKPYNLKPGCPSLSFKQEARCHNRKTDDGCNKNLLRSRHFRKSEEEEGGSRENKEKMEQQIPIHGCRDPVSNF